MAVNALIPATQYLSVIGQKFYGLQPPRNGLSSLLEMFSGGM